jgi:hypothetical protein
MWYFTTQKPEETREKGKRNSQREAKRVSEEGYSYWPEAHVDGSADESVDDEYDPTESQESKWSHKRIKKTGENVTIPFDVLKSPKLVSTVVRNNISPTALAATVSSFVSACKGDPTKLNLHHTQSYR